MKTAYHFIFLFLLNLLWQTSASAQSEKYRVAVIIPLSGQVASLGNYVKKGIDLAYNSLASADKDKIEILYEDDQFDPKKTIVAYRNLKQKAKVNAVFVIGSPTANALVSITEKDKTILMAIGASDPSIAVGKTYSFIHWVIPPVLAEKLVKELAKRNLTKIAFVVADTSGAVADANAATELLSEANSLSKVVYRQDFMRENTDFKSALLQMKQKKVDAVVAVLFSGALSSFAKQFREMHMNAELVGMETFEDEAEVKAANGALLDTWYVNSADNSKQFVDSYRSAYNEHPGWGAANGYDSLMLVFKAVSTSGDSNDLVGKYLREVKNYAGAAGVYSASGDNRFTLPAALKKVTTNGFESFE